MPDQKVALDVKDYSDTTLEFSVQPYLSVPLRGKQVSRGVQRYALCMWGSGPGLVGLCPSGSRPSVSISTGTGTITPGYTGGSM